MAYVLLGVLWLGLTLYAVLGGADLGVGIWHLTAGGADRRRERDLVERTPGPVRDANQVWLILVLTLFWIGFPAAFGAFSTTLCIPLALIALGTAGRGAAVALRAAAGADRRHRGYRLIFGVSSAGTAFVLGAVAGAAVSGRVPPVVGAGDIVGSWLNPTSVYCGVLTVGGCAYLAAVDLTGDAVRAGDRALAETFRRRALHTGFAVAVLALAGLSVLRADTPVLIDGLTGRALPIIIAAMAGGLTSMLLVAARRYPPARLSAVGTVAALLWTWGAALYPVLLHPGLIVAHAPATPTVLSAVLAALAVSAVVLVPAIGWLFVILRQDGPAARRARR